MYTSISKSKNDEQEVIRVIFLLPDANKDRCVQHEEFDHGGWRRREVKHGRHQFLFYNHLTCTCCSNIIHIYFKNYAYSNFKNICTSYLENIHIYSSKIMHVQFKFYEHFKFLGFYFNFNRWIKFIGSIFFFNWS